LTLLQPFPGDGPALTLRNLGSDLLELILACVHNRTSRMRSRMRCCEVPRVLEALVYATTSEAILVQERVQSSAPPSSVCNALCTAALSKQLKSATLAFPAACARADAALISAAAATMLRLDCRSLTELNLYGEGMDVECVDLPLLVALAAQQCVSVTTLDLLNLRLTTEVSQVLAAAIRAMPLEYFEATYVKSDGGGGGSTVQALCASSTLRSIAVIDVGEASEWAGVFTLPQLTALRFEFRHIFMVNREDAVGTGVFAQPGRGGLALELLHVSAAVNEPGQVELAGSLQCMSRLRDLPLHVDLLPAGASALAVVLPTLAALMPIDLHGTHGVPAVASFHGCTSLRKIMSCTWSASSCTASSTTTATPVRCRWSECCERCRDARAFARSRWGRSAYAPRVRDSGIRHNEARALQALLPCLQL